MRIGVIVGAVAAALGCTAAMSAGTDPVASIRAFLTAGSSPLQFPFPGGSGDYLTSDGNFAVDSVYGGNAGQPAPPNTFQGTESFTVHDAQGHQLGTVDALVSHGMSSGNNNLQVLITGIHPADGVNPGTAPGDLPNVGSVFNWGGTDGVTGTPAANNAYMSLAGGNPDPITGPPTTGNEVANGGLLGLLGSLGFDGTAHVDVHTALVNPNDFTLPNGDYVIAVGAKDAPALPDGLSHLNADAAETYDAMTNTAPYAVAVQGTQLFEIVDPKSGDVVGTFMGRTISTADLAGGHSYEILVTGDQMMANGHAAAAANLGSGADQLPTNGSVFNMLYYFSPTNYSVYTDYNGTGADGANQINGALNLFGMHFATTWNGSNFDAVKGFTDGTNLFAAIPYADGSFIKPVQGSEIFTGINGMPNGGFSGTNTVVQGIKGFTWTDSNGDDHTFNADITTFGNGSVNDVTLYLNPDQFNYGTPAAILNGEGGLDPTADPATYFAGGPLGGGALPTELAPGSELEMSDHGWYSTLTVDTPGTDGGADTVTHMLSIPLLGGAWTDVPASSFFWTSLIFNFPTL